MIHLAITLLSLASVDESYRLTVGGWITMITSVGFVTGLLGWCIRRVTRETSPEKLHSQVDIDTRDSNGG